MLIRFLVISGNLLFTTFAMAAENLPLEGFTEGKHKTCISHACSLQKGAAAGAATPQ